MVSDAVENLYEYYYFAPETHTDEKNCLIPNKLSGAYSEFESFIKSTNNKIPEYAREYKREYQFIRGINKEFKYFINKLDNLNNGLFESYIADRIKYFMKRFLRGQEKGKLKDISDLVLQREDINNLIFINEQFGYYKLRYDAINNVSDSDEDFDEVNEVVYPGFGKLYKLFKIFYNKLNIYYEEESDYEEEENDEDFHIVRIVSDYDSDYSDYDSDDFEYDTENDIVGEL